MALRPIPANQRNDFFVWREWILGEGRFRDQGPRSHPRPRVRFGAPGQSPVPPLWWAHLEAFLARRHDSSEDVSRPKVRDRVMAPVRRTPADPLRLSSHFHVREFACKDGRQVPKVALPALRSLVMVLERMRGEFGPCLILSAYRPADYNRRIGGVRFSQHIYELTPSSVAADVTFARGTPHDWYRFADRMGVGGLGRYSGFLHLDNRPGRARWTG